MNFKKIGEVFTNKFVGPGPSSYKKTNLPGRGLTKFEKHWSKEGHDLVSVHRRPLYMKTYVGFIVASDIFLP
jgi:hypothetical protein